MPYQRVVEGLLLPELRLLRQVGGKHVGLLNLYVEKTSSLEICRRCATPCSATYDRRWAKAKDVPAAHQARLAAHPQTPVLVPNLQEALHRTPSQASGCAPEPPSAIESPCCGPQSASATSRPSATRTVAQPATCTKPCTPSSNADDARDSTPGPRSSESTSTSSNAANTAACLSPSCSDYKNRRLMEVVLGRRKRRARGRSARDPRPRQRPYRRPRPRRPLQKLRQEFLPQRKPRR